MRQRALVFLVCPDCHGELRSTVESFAGDEVVEGRLTCAECAIDYPIRRGIPRFPCAEPETARERRLRDRFAWQARRFGTDGFGASDAGPPFESFVAPLEERDFQGRVVLEAGCGTGRWAIAAARWGARDVLAIDVGDAALVARENARGHPTVHVVQADLRRLPLRRGFTSQIDLAFSIGVLHHLEDPLGGLRALADVTRRDGRVHFWLYAAEGNTGLASRLDPLRSHVTSRLPLPVVSGLAFALCAGLYPVSRLVSHSRETRVPYGAYLGWLGRFPFGHARAVLHDFLSTPLTRYVSRWELERWLRESGLEEVELRHRNAHSWTVLARHRSLPAMQTEPISVQASP
jgi:SAM-dependent methyltransferase